jgi:hypothetical protein
MEIFNAISSLVPGYEEERGSIIGRSEHILANAAANKISVYDVIMKLTRSSSASPEDAELLALEWNERYEDAAFKKAVSKRTLLWTLSNIVYYYGESSESKLSIINGLLEKWPEIDKSIIYEMKDSAETYTALNAYGDFLDESGHLNRVMSSELEKSRADLNESVKTLIALG